MSNVAELPPSKKGNILINREMVARRREMTLEELQL